MAMFEEMQEMREYRWRVLHKLAAAHRVLAVRRSLLGQGKKPSTARDRARAVRGAAKWRVLGTIGSLERRVNVLEVQTKILSDGAAVLLGLQKLQTPANPEFPPLPLADPMAPEPPEWQRGWEHLPEGWFAPKQIPDPSSNAAPFAPQDLPPGSKASGSKSADDS